MPIYGKMKHESEMISYLYLDSKRATNLLPKLQVINTSATHVETMYTCIYRIYIQHAAVLTFSPICVNERNNRTFSIRVTGRNRTGKCEIGFNCLHPVQEM